MEHGIEYITLYVKKNMAPFGGLFWTPLARVKQLGAPAFVYSLDISQYATKS